MFYAPNKRKQDRILPGAMKECNSTVPGVKYVNIIQYFFSAICIKPRGQIFWIK